VTLQNGLKTKDASYLWSDTGFYSGEEKKLLYHEDKIFVGSGWPWAILHSGTQEVCAEVEDAICVKQPASLSALISCLQLSLKPHLGHEWEGGQRVLIAAYEGGPHLLIIGTKELAGRPPLVPVPLNPHMISSDSKVIRWKVAKGVNPDNMTRIIRQQHKDCLLEGHWPLAGKVTRACVSRDGVELVEVDDLPDLMEV
jgi:hypothetical protein